MPYDAQSRYLAGDVGHRPAMTTTGRWVEAVAPGPRAPILRLIILNDIFLAGYATSTRRPEICPRSRATHLEQPAV